MVASTVPVPISITRAMLMRLFSTIVTGCGLLPNSTTVSMLTFPLLQEGPALPMADDGLDPADASDATLMAVSNAANARSP